MQVSRKPPWIRIAYIRAIPGIAIYIFEFDSRDRRFRRARIGPKVPERRTRGEYLSQANPEYKVCRPVLAIDLSVSGLQIFFKTGLNLYHYERLALSELLAHRKANERLQRCNLIVLIRDVESCNEHRLTDGSVDRLPISLARLKMSTITGNADTFFMLTHLADTWNCDFRCCNIRNPYVCD